MFLCARCRDQVLLCSHCDRGQQYCSRACSSASRRERRREAAVRYQGSLRGQLNHAARSACWRQRRRSRRALDAGMVIDKVTHQGCPGATADASLPACETPGASALPINPVSAIDTAVALTVAVEPAVSVCRRCARVLRPYVRQGYLHGMRPHHDHRPGAGRTH
jgi:hypothetical protein